MLGNSGEWDLTSESGRNIKSKLKRIYYIRCTWKWKGGGTVKLNSELELTVEV